MSPKRQAEEYRAMADEELETRLTETKQELFNLRFQNVTGQLDNSARIGQVKREIARMATVMRLREIEAAEQMEAAEAAEAAGSET